jgi:hypothetical protein
MEKERDMYWSESGYDLVGEGRVDRGTKSKEMPFRAGD